MESKRKENPLKSSDIGELRKEKIKSKTKLRKGKIEEVLNQKRNIQKPDNFFIIQNFVIDEELLRKLEDTHKIVKDLAPCDERAKQLRSDLKFVNQMLNFLLFTNDTEQIKKLLDIFSSWSFSEGNILEMISLPIVAENLYNKVFNVFVGNQEIFEHGTLLFNHMILGECNCLEDLNFRNKLLSLYLNCIGGDNYFNQFSLSCRNSLMWGTYLILNNYRLEEHLVEIKGLVLKRSIEEINYILSNFTVSHCIASNSIKIMMGYVYEFLDPEARERDYKKNLVSRCNMIKTEAMQLFTVDSLGLVFNMMVSLSDKFLPFDVLAENPMNYSTSECHKYVLKILIAACQLKPDIAAEVMKLVDMNKFRAFFFGCFHYYKDGFRFCDTFNLFFSFLVNLTKFKSSVLEQFFNSLGENDFLKFNYFCKDTLDQEIRICFNFFNNYPLNTCKLMYKEDLELDIAMKGIKQEENNVVRENALTLLQTILNAYSENQQIEPMKEKVARRNAVTYIERIYDLDGNPETADMVRKAKELVCYLVNTMHVEDDDF